MTPLRKCVPLSESLKSEPRTRAQAGMIGVSCLGMICPQQVARPQIGAQGAVGMGLPASCDFLVATRGHTSVLDLNTCSTARIYAQYVCRRSSRYKPLSVQFSYYYYYYYYHYSY